MPTATLADVERVVRVMAETVVANETYFGELDAVVGDGDFGYSMARGFELVLADWDSFDRTDIATFLRKVRGELSSPDASHTLDLLARLSMQTNFSVGCYCASEAHCHRSVLRALLAEKGAQLAT